MSDYGMRATWVPVKRVKEEGKIGKDGGTAHLGAPPNKNNFSFEKQVAV
jgi:hypothetical protein